jgi:type I restriction enzyme R subunit
LKALPDGERDDERIKQLEFLKVLPLFPAWATMNPATSAKQGVKHWDARDAKNSFRKDFDYKKPESGIGIICVCDRLITGFDAPIEQVMYLDKIMREHDLFQAITRVNRTKKGKSFGLIVDYIRSYQTPCRSIGNLYRQGQRQTEKLPECIP